MEYCPSDRHLTIDGDFNACPPRHALSQVSHRELEYNSPPLECGPTNSLLRKRQLQNNTKLLLREVIKGDTISTWLCLKMLALRPATMPRGSPCHRERPRVGVQATDLAEDPDRTGFVSVWLLKSPRAPTLRRAPCMV